MLKLISCLFCVLFASSTALAHGGEDHGDKAAVPLSTNNGVVASVMGSVFEVVLKAPIITPGEEIKVRLLLSDFESNAPVKEASIDIEMKSASARLFSGKASPTKTDGVYEFSTTFPSEGMYSFDLTIQAKDRADLLAISGFEVKVSEAAPETNATPLKTPMLVGGGLGIFFFSLALGFTLGRLRRAPVKENSAALLEEE